MLANGYEMARTDGSPVRHKTPAAPTRSWGKRLNANRRPWSSSKPAINAPVPASLVQHVDLQLRADGMDGDLSREGALLERLQRVTVA